MSQIIPYLAPGALTNTQSDVTDLQSLSGVPDNSVNLGTFTGSTIPDNQTTKQALQALETEVEDRLPDFVQWRVGTGPGYYLTAAGTNIQGGLITLGTGDFSVSYEVDFYTSIPIGHFFYSNLTGSNYFTIRILGPTNYRIEFFDGATTNIDMPVNLSTGKQRHVLVADRDGLAKLFVNNKLAASADISSKSNVDLGSGGGNWQINSALTGQPCVVTEFRLLNRAASDAEVSLLSRGQRLGFADRGADGTEATSGTLTVGKRYRISDFQSGDDFTNVGAASNATGVEFVATGTTPTTWTNSSGVTQIGEVLSLLPSGAAPTVWADQSGNGYNGTVTGATLINPMPLHADAFVSLTNLPTSSAGLATGRVWNDSGTLKIV